MDTPERTASWEAPESSGFVWPSVGRPGLVPVAALVGDPGQPRQYFSEVELSVLAASIEADDQKEIITVCELTEEERSSGAFPAGARYMIVSGERRWRAARKAGLETVEIQVKSYGSRGDQMLASWILNEDRIGLSEFEMAHFIPCIAAEKGWVTQEQIARGLRRSNQWVSRIMSIHKLIPEFQARMHPRLPKNKRLKIHAAAFIAGLEPDVQRSLYHSMPPALQSVSQQLVWMRKEVFQRGISSPSRKRSPSKLRMRVLDIVSTFARTIDTLCFAPDVSHMFEGASEEQIKDTLGHITRARALLDAFERQVMRLANERGAQSKNGAGGLKKETGC